MATTSIQIQPCFATWWTYEFMGLTLTEASQQMRDTDDARACEADAIERLGTLMWMEAQALLPSAAHACGVTTLPPDH